MPLAATTRPAGQLDADLRALGLKVAADLLGVADMTRAFATMAAMNRRPVRMAWPRAVSIGAVMDDRFVDGIPKVTADYGKHFSGQAGPTARKVAGAIVAWLKKEGFRSATSAELPGGGTKVAARYAGLAWIGKSCLAVSPQAGPRVAWEVVFTDAPLTPTAKGPMERQCGDCRRCVDVCPVKAYTGIPFDEKDPPQKRYDTGKCSRYRGKLGNMFGVGACGLCLEICPYGRKGNILLGQRPVVPPASQPAR
jgi:ferredoxin